jgi:hypothetical protein
VYADMELWQRWNPHVKSQLLEDVDVSARVLTARSELPIIDPRDTVFFTTRWEGVMNPESGATEERPGHFTTVGEQLSNEFLLVSQQMVGLKGILQHLRSQYMSRFEQR